MRVGGRNKTWDEGIEGVITSLCPGNVFVALSNL
jgi:hypothetical protein